MIKSAEEILDARCDVPEKESEPFYSRQDVLLAMGEFVDQQKELYVFEFCPMIYESEDVIMSYHKTEAGAIKAMEEHKELKRLKHTKMWEGEDYPCEFAQFESWNVRKFDLIIEE